MVYLWFDMLNYMLGIQKYECVSVSGCVFILTEIKLKFFISSIHFIIVALSCIVLCLSWNVQFQSNQSFKLICTLQIFFCTPQIAFMLPFVVCSYCWQVYLSLDLACCMNNIRIIIFNMKIIPYFVCYLEIVGMSVVCCRVKKVLSTPR